MVRKALTYERCIGESLSMIIEGEYFEAVTSKEHGGLCHEYVPQLDHLDRTVGMQCSEPPHIILRKGLITAIEYRFLAEHMFKYMVDSLFYGSLLYRPTTEHKCAAAVNVFVQWLNVVGMWNSVGSVSKLQSMIYRHYIGMAELHIAMQIYKEWRLKRIEPTWDLSTKNSTRMSQGRLIFQQYITLSKRNI
ncbi:methylthioribose kinase-like [Gossypium australe]|uniref:Methylthioribose kinase-like n=1 Tax=Gossypium australe TaxID=47621 RepID=A0A5B6X488_9ROSI|nr:methylthioribose kinase-like [Gossypium australe]